MFCGQLAHSRRSVCVTSDAECRKRSTIARVFHISLRPAILVRQPESLGWCFCSPTGSAPTAAAPRGTYRHKQDSGAADPLRSDRERRRKVVNTRSLDDPSVVTQGSRRRSRSRVVVFSLPPLVVTVRLRRKRCIVLLPPTPSERVLHPLDHLSVDT